ncbi:MAG: hypothetical protein CMJ18_23995 [Phycisphaeraceae bacterium]|nr:hypothetical protein [Phycisphaeraceae bacterium]
MSDSTGRHERVVVRYDGFVIRAFLVVVLLIGMCTGQVRAAEPRFSAERLYAGFHAYGYMHDRVERRGGMKYEQSVVRLLDLVQRHGFNCLYLAVRQGELDDGRFDFWLAQCAARDIRLVCQLDFAYLRNGSDVDAFVRKAVSFQRRYGKHEAVLAISVREEPLASLLPKLKVYYEGILREVPDARIQLTHAKTNAAALTPEPYPHLMGGDPYPFHWTAWAQGYTATPAYGFTWYRKRCHNFWEAAAVRGSLYQLTFTSNAYCRFYTEPELIERYAEKKPDLLERIRRWAKDGNQSWFIDPETGRHAVWMLHRPPPNATRAMVWIGFMEGAKSMLHWSLVPSYPPDLVEKDGPAKVKHFNAGGIDLAGDGPELAEYAASFREIRRFENLILNMRKDTTSLIGAPGLMHRMHELDTGQWLAVVVNTHIGAWNDGNSTFLAADDRYRFDERGRAIDFRPDPDPRTFRIEVPVDLGAPFDLHTGRALRRAKEGGKGSYSLDLLPGRGRFLLVASKADLSALMPRVTGIEAGP